MRPGFVKTTLLLSLFYLLQSCNPLGTLENVDPNLGQNNSANAGIQNASWDFTNSGDYTFDPNYISVTASKATLLQVDQTHDEASDFAGGTHKGTQWDGVSLTLGNAGGCDGTISNCSELDASWTPKYANLVAHWPFNNNLIDNIGGITATSSSETYATGFINNHLDLTAAGSDTVTIGNITNFPTGNSPRAISFWIRLDAAPPVNGRRIFQSAPSSTNGRALNLFLDTNARLSFSFTGANLLTDNPLKLNRWHHFVFVVPIGATLTGQTLLYRDGQLDPASYIAPGTTLDTVTYDFILDAIFGQLNFDFDDFALWNNQLTATEIKQIYDRQSAKYAGEFYSPIINLGTSGDWLNLDWVTSLPFGKELPGSSGNELSANYASLVNSTGTNGDSDLSNGLVGLWDFNETIAGTAPDGSDFADKSGNGFHLTGNSIFQFGSDDSILARAVNIAGNAQRLTASSTGGYAERSGTPLGNSRDWTVAFWIKPNTLPRTGSFNTRSRVFDIGLNNSCRPCFNFDDFAGSSVSFLMRQNGGSGTVYKTQMTLSLFIKDKWQLVVGTYDGIAMKAYFNGKLDASSNPATQPQWSANTFSIGAISDAISGVDQDNGSRFPGLIDEFSIWDRALHESEILELYRRGANRVRYQVRSCDDSACAGESWIGPNGTASTYFSELHNCASINAATGECDGNVQTSSPSLDFSEFVSAPVNNQYFQYRAILESDDQSAACAGGTQNCMPSVSSIEIGPTGRYFGGSPMIVNTTPVGFSSLSAFSETTGGACTVTYQVSSDGITFYYWSGTAWAVASGVIQSNNAADINANISGFTGTAGAGSLFWRAFLTSDTSQDCELDELNFSF